MRLARIGAGFYLVWGIVHLLAALDGFRVAAGIDGGMVQGRLFQNAWSLLFFSIVAIAVAVRMNWKNSPTGYLINLVVVSVANIGFVVFVLLPGHVAMWPGIFGPLFWLSAVFFSTLAIRLEQN